MAKIIISTGGTVWQEMELSKARITIGRRSDNDIVLDNMAISAEHAVIFAMGGNTFLEDQNSKNGTQVNGVPVKKHMLQHDEVIELAHFRIRFIDDGIDHVTAGNPDGIGMKRAAAVVKILNGESAGKEIVLTKLITTIGRPGVHVAVITQLRGAYFLTHVEGGSHPLVNGKSIGGDACKLTYGDVIDLSGSQLAFSQS